MIGDLPGFGPVWFNEGSIANILSLAAVRKVCRVTMDSHNEPAMFVHKQNGKVMKFIESDSGLYYYDASSTNRHPLTMYTFLHTVSDNKSLYTTRQLKGADLAKRVYELVGQPSHVTF
jgi:hypothetical protein